MKSRPTGVLAIPLPVLVHKGIRASALSFVIGELSHVYITIRVIQHARSTKLAYNEQHAIKARPVLHELIQTDTTHP